LRQERANFQARGVYHPGRENRLYISTGTRTPQSDEYAGSRQLHSRNHDVLFISLPDGEPSVRAAGLTFLPCAVKEFPADSLTERRRRMSKLEGEEALRATLQNIADRTEAMFNSLPAALTAAAVDAVVLDTALPYIELVPMSLGMSYAHVANALHFDYSGYTPFCCYDWPHETTPAALARNQKGVERFQQTLAPTIAVGRAYAKRVGLDVDWGQPLRYDVEAGLDHTMSSGI
jgi:zeaxanthin glucosyltransferase